MQKDRLDRPLRSLRISVTDRCNLRCTYCMPELDYTWLPRADVLCFEEVVRLTKLFQELGVTRIRLTGGEPLLRRDLSVLVAMLADLGLQDIALTTNGVLLPSQAEALRRAGLQRVTVSIDSLRPERFRRLTGRDDLLRAVAGVEAAASAGYEGIKINTVVMRGDNEDELVDMLEFGRRHGAEVRFIEYMDVGGATRWNLDKVVSRREIQRRLGEHYGGVEPMAARSDSAPADRFVLPDGLAFGIISSTTQPFCSTCDRSRLTADGVWLTCLYAEQGLDLRGELRTGKTDAEIRQQLTDAWQRRQDQGAVDRLALQGQRLPLHEKPALTADPHLEMHTRGG